MLMSLTRHQKFRPVLIAGITAVVVGGTGAAFAATHASSGTTDHAALASSTLEIPVSASATPTAGAGTTATPTKPATKHHKKKHHKKKHRHGHHKPTASPTTTAPTTGPTTPVTPTAEPTKPTTAPSTSTSAPATTTAPSTGGTQTQKFQAQVLALTNAERKKAGCNVALTANTALTKAAQDHAEDMLKNNYFEHNSQDGTSPFDRMTAAGYKWSGAAENIAAGQATPESVMTSWMNSPGHKANILNCGLKDLGVGYAAGSGAAYGQYWVQDFGSPLN
jgi:uncharacterized protein YkwD